MSKRLHAKDLRRDEVAEVVTHAAEGTYEFSKAHRSSLMYGGIALLAIALVSVLVAWRMDSSRRAALEAYSGASRAWAEAAGETVLEEGATKPSWDDVAARFATVADEHDGTPAGKLAALHHGLALGRAGKGQEAASALETFVDENPSHWGTPEALAALAVAHEDAGNVAGAEAALKKLQEGEWRAWPAGAADVLLAQLYERTGRSADARALYEQVAKDEKLKDSTWASQAEARLAEMGEAPSAG